MASERYGYDREEMRAEGRASVMAWWRRVERSGPGMWLARHTRLLARLSDEETHLAGRAGLLVALVALVVMMLAAGLVSFPAVAVAFAAAVGLAVFWDAYRDSGERAADWLSTRPGVATWRQVAADYGPRAVGRDVVPAVLPRMLASWRDGSPGAVRPMPARARSSSADWLGAKLRSGMECSQRR